MELGATVCTVKSPSCSACPLQDACLARKLTADTASNESSGSRVGRRRKSAEFPMNSSRVPGQSCRCEVCEVDDEGLAELPLEVTDFPRKAAKT